MTEYEINELMLAVQGSFTPLVQFWVSISFATVVAAFFTANRLNKSIIRLMAFLYVLTSLFVASVYFNYAVKLRHYYKLAKEAGFNIEHYSNFSSNAAAILVGIVFICGTIGTLFYLYKSERDSE